ncbi:ATP synthase-coupling factor 6, mitochondrial isoform X1 [Drosophila virilis]|uniref:Uncharacterized protein n=2 Tax=Drosophila virilis TaxID=7244 RepID=B4LVY8_DROVI|nr:uncharacterized protein Dvir_GJ23589 [Drosophila virilis]
MYFSIPILHLGVFMLKFYCHSVIRLTIFPTYSTEAFEKENMMLSQSILTGVRVLRTEARRNIAIVAPALNKASDPIQQLFLDKVREYKQKSAGGKMVDSNPEIERELKNELERVAKQYGSDGKTDMLKFPEFKFPDVKIDPISQGTN